MAVLGRIWLIYGQPGIWLTWYMAVLGSPVERRAPVHFFVGDPVHLFPEYELMTSDRQLCPRDPSAGVPRS